MANISEEKPAEGIVNTARGILGRYSEVLLPVIVLTMLTVMLVPLPASLLDLGLALSLTMSIVILVTVVMLRSFEDFTAFPSMLLMATLLRLALNIASTRLILSEGHTGANAAGRIIESFGNVIVAGNYVIGFIIFLVLVIINFVVITRGSGRIAEVSARFTLDALPGKQMAIDADLSSGLIDEDTARNRRRTLDEQSSFFGSMDGASKFVRGDAIAGIIITFINIVGGLLVGTLQQDMSFATAAQNYTILTIGDGLVTQIPSLLISVAAGMMVTKSGTVDSADTIIAKQLSRIPTSWWIVSVALLAFAILPGMPALPFIILSALCVGLGFMIHRRDVKAKAIDAAVALSREETEVEEEAPISETLAIDTVRLELGYGLLTMVGGNGDASLPSQVKGLRKQFASEFGFVIPAVRIQDNLQLGSSTYIVRIKEIEVARGDLKPNMVLVMDPKGGDLSFLGGEPTKEPIFGLNASWVPENMQEEAQFRGLTVARPATVITTHLSEVIKDNMADLLSYTEMRKLLDNLNEQQKQLVEEIVPAVINYSTVQQILRSLLSERVSIRDLGVVVESIAWGARQTQNPQIITELVRSKLARQISDSNTNMDGTLELVTLSTEWEGIFADSLAEDEQERRLAISPSNVQRFMDDMRKTFEEQAQAGRTPVLLVSPGLRPYVRQLIERFRPNTVVMSQSEVHPRAKLHSVGQVG